MKLAVVVQRYGADISGGAELHARYIAERLSRHATVEVLTTCATDYITWKNDLPAGESTVNGVKVRRFPVASRVTREDFGRRSRVVFEQTHSIHDELTWLTAEGPTSPALVQHIERAGADVDYFLFFSYRYYHAYHGLRGAPAKAVLVPTAERDPAIGLEIFKPMFRAARAVMFNSLEERAMIQAVAATARPGRRRRRGIGDSGAHAALALPQEVQDQAAVRDLHRPHRREQGLRGAVRVLRALRGDVPARARPRARRIAASADPEASANPASRVS